MKSSLIFPIVILSITISCLSFKLSIKPIDNSSKEPVETDSIKPSENTSTEEIRTIPVSDTSQPASTNSLIDKQNQVTWYTFEEAVELYKREPRKIMIDVYTDWCGYCKIMDRNTFSNPIIAGYLNEKYYPVKLNAEQKEDIQFNEKIFRFVPQGARGFHELAAALLNGQMSYPSIVFLDEQLRIIHIQKGYTETKPFDEIIQYIGGDYYKTQAWNTWKASYKSPF